MLSNNDQNGSKDFFYSLSKTIYMFGGPNYWCEELKLPKLVHKIHRPLSILTHPLCILIIALEWGALKTQTDLSEKQKSDLFLWCFAHPFCYSYVLNGEYYEDKIRDIVKILAVDLDSYNNKEIEREMMKRIRYFSLLCLGLIALTIFMYGVDGFLQMLTDEGTYTTVIIAWPDVKDQSRAAGVVRFLIYVAWWIFMIRVSTVSYCMAIPLTICLSYQFKNLKTYFYSLNAIFDGNEDQNEKEEQYEQAFKIGIKLHATILRCTKLTQETLAVVFGGQILANVTVLIFLMSQFVNAERTLPNTFSLISTSVTLLTGTGCFMWNAGDVTVEASSLSTAMFESGWHNCRTKAAIRLRSMITIAMWQSQRPVQLRCLGVVELSYESYLTIVKSSYSLFSVLY